MAHNNDNSSADFSLSDEDDEFAGYDAMRKKYKDLPLKLDLSTCKSADHVKSRTPRVLRNFSLSELLEERNSIAFKMNNVDPEIKENAYLEMINKQIAKLRYPGYIEANDFLLDLEPLVKSNDKDMTWISTDRKNCTIKISSTNHSKWTCKFISDRGQPAWSCRDDHDCTGFILNHHEIMSTKGDIFKTMVWRCLCH